MLEKWIILGLAISLVLFFSISFILDIFWNKRLEKFQKENDIDVNRNSISFFSKRLYGLVVSVLVLSIVSASVVIVAPNPIHHETLYAAQTVESETILKSLIKDFNNIYRDDKNYADGMFPEVDSTTSVGEEKPKRDYIGTNVQVEGVEEADIVKTDGNTIYYATRFTNKIRIFDISIDNKINVREELDLELLYTESLYLTETQLIVIGYTYNYRPYDFTEAQDNFRWGYYSFTGTVNVYNRNNLKLIYSLETDTNFYEHRLIENSLFLVSNKSIQDDFLTPQFKEYKNGNEENSTLDYTDIFYFKNMPIYSMTVITGINLTSYEVKSKAYLGGVNFIYGSLNSIYTVNSFSDYDSKTKQYNNYTQIVKYELDIENSEAKYITAGRVKGYISDQYWMDEYNGYFRVVTSTWGNVKNRLYVLKDNYETKELEVIGSITEDLGKEGETVKSVRFNQDVVYVVTFLQIDPLYTIDLSNPKNPTFISDIEELGFNTYLHKWKDNGLVGFGFSANDEGVTNGLKISAYDTDNSLLLDNYTMLYNQLGSKNSYFYSEASYNPKALMISADKGIIAFPITGWYYNDSNDDNYVNSSWTYISQYYVFYIDFIAQEADDIISEPIVIKHESTSYYSGIERGIYIDNIVYTLSYSQISSFDLNTHEVLETIMLKTEYDQANILR
ncbi:MAG TPA: hypothetical protein GX695_01015 [Acholeplasmataceae bacterium]|nr:hypothetical protein [Acholeplasmataceae bacterium]